jgi:hypothetical protein
MAADYPGSVKLGRARPNLHQDCKLEFIEQPHLKFDGVAMHNLPDDFILIINRILLKVSV